MSVHLCFQEAHRLQFPWKISDCTFNQSLFPVPKSCLIPPCHPFGHDFMLFSLPFSVALHLFILQEYLAEPTCHTTSACAFVLNGDSSIFCPRMLLFQEGSWIIFCVCATDEEAVPSRIVASQLWVWKYRGSFSTSKLCACFLGTPTFAQAVHSSVLALNFVLMHMTCSDRFCVALS